MKKLLVVLTASALVAAVPAWAEKPSHSTEPAHHSESSHDKGKCTARDEGYNARGTLVSASLTPGTKKDHFAGTLTVDVTRANHKAPDGSQSFTLTDARVRFGQGVSSTTLSAGDRVVLHGKITEVGRKCESTGATPTITVRNVEIKAPETHK